MDYQKFLTKVNKRRQPSKLRELAKYYSHDSTYAALAGGVPSPDIFCFNTATFKLRDGTEFEIDENLMNIAQQYGETEGYRPLRKIIQDFVQRLHSPPNDNWTSVLTNGCQQAICTAFEMILEEGEYLIATDHMYSGALEILRPMGINYLDVETDEHGMRADSLLKVLSRWTPEFCRQNKKETPKMIYVVPNGGNPDSITMSTERRKEIYKIAQEYDLLILEDDPYHFMVYDQEIPPSFLSLDTDGRVLLCDTFSKMISPGLRVGVLTGAKPLIEAAVKRMQISTQQISCLSQVVTYKLLSKWGFEGFLKNAERIREIFKAQRDLAQTYAKKWLHGLVDIESSSGGLFLWMKIKGVHDSEAIYLKCFQDKVVFAPGKWFIFNEAASPYLRVSFSMTTKEELDFSFSVLAKHITDHLNQTQNSRHIDHPITNGSHD